MSSRWYKADLQIASPEGGFSLPQADLRSPEGRAKAAAAYVELIKDSGLEVFAVTDHNSTSMLEEIREAARAQGIVMFPGMELSTGTGSDGVHLLLLGDPDADIPKLTSQWHQAAGFNDDHPAFNEQGLHLPSRSSLIDILDQLPDDTIAIAPHILTENGIASGDSISESSIKWRCLHHDRLEAVDVGQPGDGDLEGFNSQFRTRSLTHFPAVDRLAYVSTSDAYRPDALGRHTWIRMHKPDLASLRQAFLDYEARIFCDWDSRLDGDPNKVSHAYVKSISLQNISTSSESLAVQFDPRINVIVGSRGSGKSTIVQALRAVFGGDTDLPSEVDRESRKYQEDVFANATLACDFVEGISGAEDTATWSSDTNTVTALGKSLINVRVVSQKELFERTVGDRSGDSSASSNMLSLIDEALEDDQVAAELYAAGVESSSARIGAFTEELRKRQRAFSNAAEKRLEATEKLAGRKQVSDLLDEVKRKLDALEGEGNKEKLATAQLVLADKTAVDQFAGKLSDVATSLEELVQPEVPRLNTESGAQYLNPLQSLSARISTGIQNLMADISNTVTLHEESFASGQADFVAAVDAARTTKQEYEEKLAEVGVDLSQYESLNQQKSTLASELEDLKEVEKSLPRLCEKESAAWTALNELFLERAAIREGFTTIVSSRTPGLKFAINRFADPLAWKLKIRAELGFRQGDHVEALDKLASWIWQSEVQVEQRLNRCAVWRDSLLSNDYSALAELKLSQAFISRLSQAPENTRVALAAMRAGDALDMHFLKEGNDPSDIAAWQIVTDGSPGQRSAAMLAFTLSYGNSPLVLDQPEDDLDSALVSELVVSQFRKSRWNRQLIVVTHEANIPVNTDAEEVIVLENVDGTLRVQQHDGTAVAGSIDNPQVRKSIQNLLEGGVRAFVNRERRYDNELSKYRADLAMLSTRSKRK